MRLRRWLPVSCVFALETILAATAARAQAVDPQSSLPPVTVTPARAAPSRPLRPRPAPRPVLRAAPAAGHSGLGLATVERLVRAAHGTLTGRQIQGGFVVEATFDAPPH